MGKPWMPKTAGILNIVAGSLNAIGIILVYVALVIMDRFPPMMPALGFEIPGWILPAAGVFLAFRLLIDILAIVGGIFCLRKISWGTGLAGSIAAVFSIWLLGIPALVLVIMGRNQFR